MKRIYYITLLFVFFFNHSYSQIQIQPLITGGIPINITNAPWQVILNINSTYGCGGSIVAPNFILTAKHCVDGVSPNSIKIVAGITCKNEANGSNTFNVSDIILHPTLDVALLRLSSNISYNESRQAINYLESANSDYYNVGNAVTVSGWGWLTPNGYNPSDCLNAVTIHIISNQDAENALQQTVHDYEVATTGVGAVRQGACHGDSGGPLTILSESNEPILIGVVSWGDVICLGNNANSPSIFVRGSSIVDWINANVITISGPDVVCSQSTYTYTLSNLPTGASVSWSVSQGLSILSSANNYVNVRSLTPFGTSFEDWIKATITNNENTTTLLKNYIVSWSPGIQSISFGQETMQGDAYPTETELTLRPPSYIQLPPSFDRYGTNFMWRTNVPVWTPQFPQGKSSMLFMGNTYCGSFDVMVDFTDVCGCQSTIYRTLEALCSSYYGFSLSPNPASAQVSLEITDNTDSQPTATAATIDPTYTVSIVDATTGIPVYKGKKKGKKFNLSTAALHNGVYNVIVSDGVNTYQKKLMVKH